jgi:hypothetical protein
MNERIKQLFEQALEEFNAENKYATSIVPNPLKEKFAQLIAEDCASIVDNQGRFLTYLALAKKIRDQYGIKK